MTTLRQRIIVLEEGVPLEHFPWAVPPGEEIIVETRRRDDGTLERSVVVPEKRAE